MVRNWTLGKPGPGSMSTYEAFDVRADQKQRPELNPEEKTVVWKIITEILN